MDAPNTDFEEPIKAPKPTTPQQMLSHSYILIDHERAIAEMRRSIAFMQRRIDQLEAKLVNTIYTEELP